MKDYYTILGLNKGASFEDIKKAYRRLAHRHHPDKEGGDEDRFKEINEAYYVLSDTKRRAQYDQFGAGPGPRPQSARESGEFSPFAEGFESWFSDIMDELFGGLAGSGAAVRGTRGRDLAVDLNVTLEQVLSGLREEIAVTRWVVCDRCKGGGGEPGTTMKTCGSCNGAGRLHRVEQTFFGTMTRLVRCPGCRGTGEVPEAGCTTCKGAGRIRRSDRIAVALPPGMEDGETFMVESGGDAPQAPRLSGAKAGALYATVHVTPHPRFRREGDDLWCDEEISFLTLVRGGSMTVKALDGAPLKVKIPRSAPSGKVFRISGHGLPRGKSFAKRGGSRGDLYVTVHARVPPHPSEHLVDRLKEISDEL